MLREFINPQSDDGSALGRSGLLAMVCCKKSHPMLPESLRSNDDSTVEAYNKCVEELLVDREKKWGWVKRPTRPMGHL